MDTWAHRRGYRDRADAGRVLADELAANAGTDRRPSCSGSPAAACPSPHRSRHDLVGHST